LKAALLYQRHTEHDPHDTRKAKAHKPSARRIRGQIEGVERMLDEEKGCVEVMQLIARAGGAINGLRVKC
jgi:DNA-binding FrmR family transcriptional regulator